MGFDPATIGLISAGLGGLNQGRALLTDPDNPNAMTMSDPGQAQQLAQAQQAQVPMSQQMFGQQPQVQQTTPGIDIGQILAMLAQMGGPRG